MKASKTFQSSLKWKNNLMQYGCRMFHFKAFIKTILCHYAVENENVWLCDAMKLQTSLYATIRLASLWDTVRELGWKHLENTIRGPLKEGVIVREGNKRAILGRSMPSTLPAESLSLPRKWEILFIQMKTFRIDFPALQFAYKLHGDINIK